MLKKWRGPVLAVAMVWFTTHFGGGFASGRQLVEYFGQYGNVIMYMPIISQAIVALAFYYTLVYTIQYKTYDYGTWANHFYSPYQKVLTPIFEIRSILGIIIVAGVAVSTAGSTINEVTAVSYPALCVIISIFIFVLTIFDAEFILRIANYFALPIVVGLLVLYGANTIANFDGVVSYARTAGTPLGFLPAVWKMITYCSYQAGVGTWVAVAGVIKTKEEAKRAAIIGFLFNGILLQLAAFGIAGVSPGAVSATVPVLYMLENGVGGQLMVYITSILIIIGSLSTGVNVVYSGVRRWARVLARGKQVTRKENLITSFVLIGTSLGLSLFGLMALVSKGYGFLGFTAFPLILAPILIWGILKAKDAPESVDDSVAESK